MNPENLIPHPAKESLSKEVLNRIKDLLANGSFEIAEAEIDKALSDTPESIPLNLLKVRALNGLKQFATAICLSRRLVEQQPKELWAMAALVSSLCHNADYLEAVNIIEASGQLESPELLPFYVRAQLALNQGNAVLAAARRWAELQPGNPAASLAVARCLLSAGKHDGAEQCGLSAESINEVKALAVRFPNELPLQIRLIEFFLKERSTEEAQKISERWTSEPIPVAMLRMRCLIAIAQKNHETAVQLAREWVKEEPGSQPAHLRLIDQLRANGEAPAAYSFAKATLLKWPENHHFKQITLNLAIATGDADVARKSLEEQILSTPSDLVASLQLAKIYLEFSETDKCSSLVKTILSSSPDNPAALLLEADLAIHNGDTIQVIDSVAKCFDSPSRNEQHCNDAINFLLCAGEITQAKHYIGRYVELYGELSLRKGYSDRLALFENAISSDVFNGHKDFLERDVVSYIPPDVRAIVVVFPGLFHNASKSQIFYLILKKLGVGMIFLRDGARLGCLKGIPALGPDYLSTITALRAMAPHQGVRFHCLSTSAGGYAALRYAVDLGAESVLAFSPVTNLSPDFMSKDGRAKVLMKRLTKEAPEMCMNLRPILAQSEKPQRIDIWYGENNSADHHHAMEIADLPNVHLHVIEGSSRHDSVIEAATQGLLEGALEQLVQTGARAGDQSGSR